MRRLVLAMCLGSGLALSPVAVLAQSEDQLAPLERAIDVSPTAESYDAYAQAAFRAKRWDEAIARLKMGTQQLPGYHAGWYKLGYAYRQKRSFTEAAAAYRRYAELEPAKSDPYFGLAAALQGVGDRAGAADAYRRYIELEKAPDKQKFVEQARAELAKLAPEPAKIVEPPPPAAPTASALSLRAEADKLRRAGKLREAATAFERALAADPGNLDLHVELGDVYFAQKRYSDAVRIFRAAVDRDPGYALGWYNLAHAEAQAGDQAMAVTAYRSYIRLRPSDPDPYYGLGQACKAAGDKQGAIDAFRMYLQMEHRPELQRWIDRAKQELRDLGASALFIEGGHPGDLKNPFDHPSLEKPFSATDELKNPFARTSTRDLKNPFVDHAGYASADELLPLADAESEHLRIARELRADDILPIDLDEDVTMPEIPAVDQRERLARYAAALAHYRSVLEREASQAAVLYQRGEDRLIASDLRGAQHVWGQAASHDRTIEEAKQRLDRARQALVK